MVFNGPKNATGTFKLDPSGDSIEIVQQFKYLGIEFSNFLAPKRNMCSHRHLPFKAFHKRMVQKFRSKWPVVRTYGLSMDGLRPRTGRILYKLMLRCYLEFGGQIVALAPSQIKRSENAKILRFESGYTYHKSRQFPSEIIWGNRNN